MSHNTEQTIVINTYKSIWLEEKDTGNYTRTQKKKYFLEPLMGLAPDIRYIRYFKTLFGKKKQGVDFYKYYSDILKKGDRDKWDGESREVIQQLKSLNISITNKKILDISGEPGFFAKDLNESTDITVTGFAKEVAQSMHDILDVKAIKFDYQEDSIDKITDDNIYDIIFNRYSIGFCLDLDRYLKESVAILKQGGIFYLSFSPASRAICARWMYDDYTYLRQYTADYIKTKFFDFGLTLIGEFSEGHYSWDQDMRLSQKLATLPYLKGGFFKKSETEKFQKNLVFVFSKK